MVFQNLHESSSHRCSGGFSKERQRTPRWSSRSVSSCISQVPKILERSLLEGFFVLFCSVFLKQRLWVSVDVYKSGFQRRAFIRPLGVTGDFWRRSAKGCCGGGGGGAGLDVRYCGDNGHQKGLLLLHRAAWINSPHPETVRAVRVIPLHRLPKP